jgi:hypothetical protein
VCSARNHHWVSQQYLARFTEERRKDSQLFAFDLRTRKAFWTSPRNVCAQRDFNRIETPNLPPDVLETSLATFENEVVGAFSAVVEDPLGHSDRAWNYVLNFMSLLATRNPIVRSNLERLAANWFLQQLEAATDTPEKYAALVAKARAAGDLPENAEADFARHREFLAARQFTISFDSGYQVLGEFRAQDAVLQALGQRRWLFLEAPPDSPGFVTTDRPVTLLQKDGSAGSPDRPLSYEMRDTIVFYPLDPTLLAYGTYEMQPGVLRARRRVVAKANVLMAQHCVRQVFAPHDRFELAVRRNEYLVGAQIFDMFGERIEPR